MEVLAPIGVGFHSLSKSEYHLDPCARPSLSASTAKTLIDESPAHAWYFHPRGGAARRESTEAMDRGSLLDALIFGDLEGVAVMPDDVADFRTKAAREARDQAIFAGKLPIIASKFAQAQAQAREIRAALEKQGIVFDGVNQQAVVWEESSPLGPVLCRGRLDHWRPDAGVIYDLKIVADARPKALRRKMVDEGHDIQATAYTRAIEKLVPGLAGRVEFKFLYVCPEPPYDKNITIATMSGSMRALGRYHWETAVRAWAFGIYENNWPGWSMGEVAIEPLPYAMAEMEEGLIGGSAGVQF